MGGPDSLEKFSLYYLTYFMLSCAIYYLASQYLWPFSAKAIYACSGKKTVLKCKFLVVVVVVTNFRPIVGLINAFQKKSEAYLSVCEYKWDAYIY